SDRTGYAQQDRPQGIRHSADAVHYFTAGDAEISIIEKDGFYKAEYPKAESTDKMPVFIYRVYVEDENGKAVKERKTIPTYYLYNVAEKLYTHLGRLPKGKYTVKITAENVYSLQSEYIEKTIEI
ncbi:MAG: hypothetical protein IJB93_06685, partial [Clostridia bacterium]|nr:hypothetical protein [Clostridia bacterium]